MQESRILPGGWERVHGGGGGWGGGDSLWKKKERFTCSGLGWFGEESGVPAKPGACHLDSPLGQPSWNST